MKEDVRFMPRRRRWLVRVLLAAAALLISSTVHAQTTPQGPNEWLCDASYQNCRTPLLRPHQQRDRRASTSRSGSCRTRATRRRIIARWQAGVPVRVLVDPQANPSYPGNDQMLAALAAAGIPMRMRKATAPGILHWKMMLFAGQGIVEFSRRELQPGGVRAAAGPTSTTKTRSSTSADDPAVVQSFMTELRHALDRDRELRRLRQHPRTRRRASIRFTRRTAALNFPQAEDYAAAAVEALSRRSCSRST